MEGNPEAELRKVYRQAVVIGFALISSVLVYVLIVEWIGRDLGSWSEPLPSGAAVTLKYVLLGLSLVLFFMIKFIRNRVLSADPTTQINAPEKSSTRRLMLLLNASVVTYALCEMVALFGLVLFFLTRNRFAFYPFMVISLIYFGIYFPRYTQWEEWVNRGEIEK